MDDLFIKGIATILWGSQWADHAEEHRCVSLSGATIEEVMPAIPEIAWRMAERLAGRVEGANKETILFLFRKAIRADGADPDKMTKALHDDLVERFGNCLAYMATGTGVSWFDDHADFPIEVPSFEDGDLRYEADTTCTGRHTVVLDCTVRR